MPVMCNFGFKNAVLCLIGAAVGLWEPYSGGLMVPTRESGDTWRRCDEEKTQAFFDPLLRKSPARIRLPQASFVQRERLVRRFFRVANRPPSSKSNLLNTTNSIALCATNTPANCHLDLKITSTRHEPYDQTNLRPSAAANPANQSLPSSRAAHRLRAATNRPHAS